MRRITGMEEDEEEEEEERREAEHPVCGNWTLQW